MKKKTELEQVASRLRRAEAAWLHESRMRLRRAAAERRLAKGKVAVR
jgi:hypothetical protein